MREWTFEVLVGLAQGEVEGVFVCICVHLEVSLAVGVISAVLDEEHVLRKQFFGGLQAKGFVYRGENDVVDDGGVEVLEEVELVVQCEVERVAGGLEILLGNVCRGVLPMSVEKSRSQKVINK